MAILGNDEDDFEDDDLEEEQSQEDKEEQERLYKKYPYIVAYGRFMQSMDYYIVGQCAEAEDDGAPDDAYYKDSHGWRTVEEAPKHLKTQLEKYVD